MTDQTPILTRPLGDETAHLDLIRAMARANGVDLAEAQAAGRLEQEEWAGAVERCRGCTWQGCRQWLDACDWGEAKAPSTCVNTEMMARLREA
jgi:hypothetical protein